MSTEWGRHISEKDFQDTVVTLAKQMGWKVYHTYDSRRSEPGFPDLVLVKDRIMFIELKSWDGKETPAQAEWMRALGHAEGLVAIWRPQHWDWIESALTS